MKNVNELEVIRYATYFVKHQTTVRGVARHFGVSKSHIHKLLCKLCEERGDTIQSEKLAKEVRELLDKNKMERHIRGGNSTRLKYLKAKRGEDTI